MKTFYLTIAISYVNAVPHLEFALELVEVHGGAIWAGSEGVSFDTAQDKKGKGSRFFVKLSQGYV